MNLTGTFFFFVSALFFKRVYGEVKFRVRFRIYREERLFIILVCFRGQQVINVRYPATVIVVNLPPLSQAV